MSVWSDSPEWFGEWATNWLIQKCGMPEDKAYEIDSPWGEIERLMPYTWHLIATEAEIAYFERKSPWRGW